MFDFIRGLVEEVTDEEIVISACGIGYSLTSTLSSRRAVEIGREYKIYTRLKIRDDEAYLYGFISKEERQVFNMLNSVSGVGPKVAMGLLSFFDLTEIRSAIAGRDSKTLSKAPGVGKKTAERIILELKDKLGNVDLTGVEPLNAKCSVYEDGELIDALVSLGYTSYEAERVASSIDKSLDLESKIRMALGNLSR
ncbi:Holliday junction DNA helicase RuvA [Clostridiales bacterium KA00134]|nr:Holliday junction DNA helicase RuvA [Clostridiales bacterium KA00134]